jgi:hypothetical protein
LPNNGPSGCFFNKGQVIPFWSLIDYL